MRELHLTDILAAAIFQESENGAWHVPLAGECNDELTRTWLCITRPSFRKASHEGNPHVEASEIRHESLNSCESEKDKTPTDNSSNGGPESTQRVYDDTTTITGKRKERPPSPLD